MPFKPASPCSVYGCPERAYRRGRCAAHAAAYERTRGTSTQRGYGYSWQQTRTAFLRDHPTCELCGARARDVHHLDRKRDGGDDGDDNLVALCQPCHSRMTARGH